MADPAAMIARLDAAIARAGTTVVLQHTAVDPTTGAVTVTDSIECPAHVRATAPQDLDAASDVTEIRVILSPTGLGSFGLPARDDIIVIDGNPSNIVQIGPKPYGGRVVRVELLCRG